MNGAEALNVVVSSMARDLVRQTRCGATHPEDDTSCVLPALNGHTKHKTELSRRWTS